MKSPVLRMAICAAVLALAGSSCGNRPSRPTKISQKDVADAATQSEKAAKLATMGELLITPRQWKSAKELFAVALVADPGNTKALFYSAMLDLMEAGRGFDRYTGIKRQDGGKDAFRGSGKDDTAADGLMNLISRTRSASLMAFATDGNAGKFKTVEDATVYFYKRALPAFSSAIEKLEKLEKAGGLDLRFPLRSWDERLRFQESCEIDATEGWVCVDADDAGMFVKTVDSADVMALRLIAMGYQTYIRLGTAVSVEGAEALEAALREEMRKKPVSNERIMALIKKFRNYGVVRADHELNQLPRSVETLARTVTALREMNSLCTGDRRATGNVLFGMICVSAADVEGVIEANKVLAGRYTVALREGSEGKNAKTLEMDVPAFLSRLKGGLDLKEYLPTRFDSKGRPTAFPDATMLGLFPNGDAVLATENYSGVPYRVEYVTRRMFGQR